MLTRQLFKVVLLTTITLFAGSAFAYGPNFPLGPNPVLTPGKLCDRPDKFRYPENIAYCTRDVSYESKEILIKKYDEQLGFHIQSMDRGEFKIDHFIPLCAGGSNDAQNLWPQHRSIYQVTDPVEPLLCEKMAQGKLEQAEAVRLIALAKRDLKQVQLVLRTLRAL